MSPTPTAMTAAAAAQRNSGRTFPLRNSFCPKQVSGVRSFVPPFALAFGAITFEELSDRARARSMD